VFYLWGEMGHGSSVQDIHPTACGARILDCIQDRDSVSQAGTDGGLVQDQHLMMLSSAAAQNFGSHTKSMQITIEIQGHHLSFLIDLGSSSCFIDTTKVTLFTGKCQLLLR
jgi:hypothetical protein